MELQQRKSVTCCRSIKQRDSLLIIVGTEFFAMSQCDIAFDQIAIVSRNGAASVIDPGAVYELVPRGMCSIFGKFWPIETGTVGFGKATQYQAFFGVRLMSKPPQEGPDHALETAARVSKVFCGHLVVLAQEPQKTMLLSVRNVLYPTGVCIRLRCF